ncbi:MAG: hypothetical protein ACYDCD_07070 [Candidatus Acidiferrales bacterium]
MLRFDALHASESQPRLLQDNGFAAVAEYFARNACVTSQTSSYNLRLRTNA